MNVTMIQSSILAVAIEAARTCYSSTTRSDTRGNNVGTNDAKLLRRLINDGHESVLEHLIYTFDISGISRGCLQQLVRHRIASYSVKSTRYTLKELLVEDIDPNSFLVPSGYEEIDKINHSQLCELIGYLQHTPTPNDIAKYALPEAFKTELIMTINARSLRNFLSLRLDPTAHWEIRELANKIYDKVTNIHHIIYEDIVNETI